MCKARLKSWKNYSWRIEGYRQCGYRLRNCLESFSPAISANFTVFLACRPHRASARFRPPHQKSSKICAKTRAQKDPKQFLRQSFFKVLVIGSCPVAAPDPSSGGEGGVTGIARNNHPRTGTLAGKISPRRKGQDLSRGHIWV